MCKREEAILERLDLDDIDLVTERLKIFQGGYSGENSIKKFKSKVPKLDFTKIFEWRDHVNRDESEEEEEEEYISSESFKRREELQRRKEEVIAILNKTYAEEEEEEEEHDSERDLESSQDEIFNKIKPLNLMNGPSSI